MVMAGTKIGGQKAAQTNIKKYGTDFYRIQGGKGGKVSTTGGFAANRDLARIAGAKGGSISKVTPYGPLAVGFYAYYNKRVEQFNNVTAEEFLAMYHLGMSQEALAETIGVGRHLMSRLIKAAKQDDVL